MNFKESVRNDSTSRMTKTRLDGVKSRRVHNWSAHEDRGIEVHRRLLRFLVMKNLHPAFSLVTPVVARQRFLRQQRNVNSDENEEILHGHSPLSADTYLSG